MSLILDRMLFFISFSVAENAVVQIPLVVSKLQLFMQWWHDEV